MAAPLIVTHGCRLNTHESEVIRAHAVAAGLEKAIIVNTCAVTVEAVRQAVQGIRKLRREHPAGRLIVTGCAAQIEPNRFAAMAEVDHVIGNAEKLQPATFCGLAAATSPRLQVGDIMMTREVSAHLIERFNRRTRAIVQVQNGCDHHCTFCIIPFGRGPSRSLPAGEIVTQIRRLVEAGTREAVLSGVDLNAYGADRPGSVRLGGLVRQILHDVPDLARLRLSSIDLDDVDPELLRALAEEPRLMPHLHLSMQSGDDMILKRMRRRHRACDALRLCETARRLRPDVVFGADFIAGFPTETEAMFANSLACIGACGLTYLHVFPFSPRRGTPAARMPQVPQPVVKVRAQRLRETGDRQLDGYLASIDGSCAEILMERDGIGRTPGFAEVRYAGASAGAIKTVAIRGRTGRRLIGETTA